MGGFPDYVNVLFLVGSHGSKFWFSVGSLGFHAQTYSCVILASIPKPISGTPYCRVVLTHKPQPYEKLKVCSCLSLTASYFLIFD